MPETYGIKNCRFIGYLKVVSRCKLIVSWFGIAPQTATFHTCTFRGYYRELHPDINYLQKRF